MDKTNEYQASKINENIEMRITSMIEEVLKDSSSDEEINKHLKQKDFDAIKKQNNSKCGFFPDFTHFNFGENKRNNDMNSAKNFNVYGYGGKDLHRNLEFTKSGKNYGEELIAHEGDLNGCISKPNKFIQNNPSEETSNVNNIDDGYSAEKSIQDEIKFKSSHENLFYLNNQFLLENKETKGKSNKIVINSNTEKEINILNENKDRYLSKEIGEIQERKIKNNSYSEKEPSLNELGLLNYENFEIPKKFNSYDLSNLWQSFPFRNKSNASKKSDKNENSNNNKNIDSLNQKEKDEEKDNNGQNKYLKEKNHTNESNSFRDKDEIENADKAFSIRKLSNAPANHFCNIDIHNKYLTKGFSFNDNLHYSSLHQNNFTDQENNNTRSNIQQPTIEELLDKIKHSERINKENIKNLRGKIVKILKSQNGSRILQNSLLNDSYMIIKTILSEVEDHLIQLMVDPYANYFCQRLYEYLKLQDRLIFLKKIIGDIKGIATNKIGTYPLQSVIDHMKNPEEKKLIIYGILPFLKDISMDSQGTHVIEKLIICFDELTNIEIIDFIIENFIVFANNINSLCIIKKLIIIIKNYEIRKKILEKIINNLDNLIQNAHGNYSIQVALEISDGFYSMPIINEINGKYHKYSLLKYSSNVVERCLEIGGATVVNKFIEEICQKNKVLDLLKNSFGNYVVQKALKLSNGHFKNKLLNYIKKSVDKLTDKKLISKWTSIIETNKTPSTLGELPEKPISRMKSNDSLLSNISSNSNFSSNFKRKKNNLDNSFNSNICSVHTCAHSCKSFHCAYSNENAYLPNNPFNNYNSNSNNNNYFSNHPQPQQFNNPNSFSNLIVNFNNYMANYKNNSHFQNDFPNNNKNTNNNFFNFNKENLNTANRNINVSYNYDTNSSFPINFNNKTFYNTNSKNILNSNTSNKEMCRINENFGDLRIKSNKTNNNNYNQETNNFNHLKKYQNNYLNEDSDRNITNEYINRYLKTNNQRLNQLKDEIKYLNTNNGFNKNNNVIDKEKTNYINNINPYPKWNF